MAYKFVTPSGTPGYPAFKRDVVAMQKEVKQANLVWTIESKVLADKAAKWMSEKVKRKIRRRSGSTGELQESLLNSVRFRRSMKKGFYISVGSDLPDYWAMINYGGVIMSGYVPGFWDDSPGGVSWQSKSKGRGKGAFVYQPGQPKGKGQYMKPYYSIKGFHYVAHAYSRMRAYLLSGVMDRKVMKSR